jgi:hypothetical protein
MDGEIKFFWWSVDLGLLPRTQKEIKVLVVRLGDLVNLSLLIMDKRE